MAVSLNPTASVYEQRSEPRPASGSTDMGQADFLKLMTTQLRNQDPFEPIENGEFLGQIAQFGTVTGIQELQQSFGDLSSALQANRALQASVLVGKQVMVNGNQAELAAETGLHGAVEVPGAVSDLRVRVLGGSGETLADIELGAQASGIVEFEWDGELADGTRALPGTYTLSAAGGVAGEEQALATLAVANVNSVTLGNGADDVRLDLGALGEIALSDVRRIS
ncbi:MAG: flagellar hook assembly protein FlgD [Gammaproteobacteria bacterium]|nr:flagellar hook assembly protein FlgD [Gammaproteobacteria bacterium]